MFLIDDILFAPAKGLMFVFKEIHRRAQEELEDTPEKLRRQLLEANMLFDEGQISKEEYQIREQNILQRLNALHSK